MLLWFLWLFFLIHGLLSSLILKFTAIILQMFPLPVLTLTSPSGDSSFTYVRLFDIFLKLLDSLCSVLSFSFPICFPIWILYLYSSWHSKTVLRKDGRPWKTYLEKDASRPYSTDSVSQMSVLRSLADRIGNRVRQVTSTCAGSWEAREAPSWRLSPAKREAQVGHREANNTQGFLVNQKPP